MTEKQQQLLFDKGITNVPSDVLSSDNALAECVGMVYVDGEHKVIQRPVECQPSTEIATAVEGAVSRAQTDLVIIHRFNGVLRYILQVTRVEAGTEYKVGDICFKIKSGDTYTVKKVGINITGEVNAETIGNTLILSSTAGMNYLLWDYVNNKYKNLGTQIPDIQMRFSLYDVGFLGIDYTGEPYTGERATEERIADLDPNTFVKLPKIDGEWFDDTKDGSRVCGNKWKADTGSDYEDAKAGLIGLVSARLNWVKERKRFAFPFWARSAVRLYDGSYVNISNPFLLMPTVLNNWHIFACDYQKPYTPRIQYIDDDGPSAKNWIGWDQTNYMPLCAKLMYKAVYSDFVKSDWEDIISGVDIFVSEEVKNFDMEGKWTILNVDSQEMKEGQPKAYTADTCDPIYFYMKSVNKYKPEDDKTWNTYYKPSLLSESELTDRLLKQSVFYKIVELDLDDVEASYDSQSPMDSTAKMDRGVLTNLTTQPTLENDDYFSHSEIVPGIIKTYNSRLHLADVWRSFYSGFYHFSYTAYTKKEGSVYVVDSAKKTYYFYVHIKSESGERIVRASGESYEIYNVWFFYPDPRAYQVDVYYTLEGQQTLYKLSSFSLKEHPGLHGAYHFGHIPGLNEVMPTGTTAEALPSTVTDMELLEGQVIVSEVDNPWLFNAAGYVTVGMGRINGLASQTVALGQEEHGIHPLIVFSERGISTLRLNNEGVYIRSDELSREVCCNRKSITETDGAVFFVSEKGLMVAVGNQVKCVSEQLSGLMDTWASEKIDTGFSNYSTFFKNCFIAYDYRDSLLWLFDGIERDVNNNKVNGLTYCLVYSIKSGTFAKTRPLTGIVTRAVNDYPDYILQSGTALYSLTGRPSINADTGTYSAKILTRPMKLENSLALKSVLRIANMGYFSEGAGIELKVFASNNIKDWAELTSLRGTPWLFYRFLYIFTGLRATDRFAGSVLITQERRNNKLRFIPSKKPYTVMPDTPNNQDVNPQPPAPSTPDTNDYAGELPGTVLPIPDPLPKPVPVKFTYKTYVNPSYIDIPEGSSSVTQEITITNRRYVVPGTEEECSLWVKIWKRAGSTYTQIAATAYPVIRDTISVTVTEDAEDIIVCSNTSVIADPTDYVCKIVVPINRTEPTPTPVDLGNYLYSVGILSDLHIDVDNDDNTPSDSDDNWWDEDDFKKAMTVFKNDSNIKFIASCGDLIESGSPAQATPEDDSAEFKNIYKVPYWQTASLRFFKALGNHDFYGMFESRQGDNVKGSSYPNSECNSGYNTVFTTEDIPNNIGVSSRIDNIDISGHEINDIRAGGRIIFDEVNDHITYSGTTPYGLGDVNFFEYNGFMGMYKDAAGWTGSMQDPTDDYKYLAAAKSMIKSYVGNNWNTCKDNLSAWNQPKSNDCGYRNRYSKLNYWLKKGNDIFIFLSVDYGDDTWPLTADWHDRMINARTIIDTESSDPYIKRMVEYVHGTGYDDADVDYNYQYYHPNALIWLKEIIENNTDKKIYVFMHHFLTHKAGNSNGIPTDGAYKYSRISKDGVQDDRTWTNDYLANIHYNKGSNALSGIEFWFLNKLNNTYKNVIFFSGHSHISWENDCHFVNHDYNIVSPSLQNDYVYTRLSNTEISASGYTVSLPSLSKPRFIKANGESERRYEDAESTIMEIYEYGVKIKGYKIVQNRVDLTNNGTSKGTLLREQEIILLEA